MDGQEWRGLTLRYNTHSGTGDDGSSNVSLAKS